MTRRNFFVCHNVESPFSHNKVNRKAITHIRKLALCLTALVATVLTSSCDSFIYEDEGDCDPYYKVRFVYDMNLKFADAFPQEVNSVTLYVADATTGAVVWSKHESGQALRSADYVMDVDVPPGNYTLLVWAGDGHRTHFAIPEAQTHKALTCTMLRDHANDGSAYIDHPLDRLYHGKLEAQEFPASQGVHTYTVPLVKNTNTVTVLLQHVSGEPVDPELFDFTISDVNGLMDWDNSLMPDEEITYRAHTVSSGTASFDPDPDGSRAPVVEFSAALAEHTVARLMDDHSNSCRLTITNRQTGQTVLSIPLIKYVLLVRDMYNRPMDSQEYLDRQDQYSLTFFLDSGNRWVQSHIYINSWKIVLRNYPEL